MRRSVYLLLFLFVIVVANGGCGGNSGGSGSSDSSPSALCNDGTYSYSKNCSGTCSSHGGVKTWYMSCGSKSLLPALTKKEFLNVDPLYSGLWEGRWISDKHDHTGMMHINLSDEGLIEGKFFNNDNSLNSKVHGYLNNNGIATVFIDVPLYSNGNIEYEGEGLLSIFDNQLMGNLNIQEKDITEIREFELYRQ